MLSIFVVGGFDPGRGPSFFGDSFVLCFFVSSFPLHTHNTQDTHINSRYPNESSCGSKGALVSPSETQLISF